jgi:hypothetical protein
VVFSFKLPSQGTHTPPVQIGVAPEQSAFVPHWKQPPFTQIGAVGDGQAAAPPWAWLV